MSLLPKKRGPEDVPGGQPRARPRTLIVFNRNGKKLPKFVYPHQIVPVKSKEDLKEAFDHYGHPFPMMEGSVSPKNRHAMRKLIEQVFPALRWFCKVYGEPVPSWLEGNGWADDISEEDHKKYFGPEPLKVREFKEDERKGGQRA